MIEAPRIKVGIDYDGVILKKAAPWDIPRRASKMGLPTLLGANEGINYLEEQEDVDVLGVYTVRPEWLRREQTRRQVERRHLPIDRIVHTTNSPEKKIEALLKDARANGMDRDDKILLIDDSIDKVIDAAEDLYFRNRGLRSLLERFTLVAFNPKQPEKLKGRIIPGVVHIVEMRDWEDVASMLNTVRSTNLD